MKYTLKPVKARRKPQPSKMIEGRAGKSHPAAALFHAPDSFAVRSGKFRGWK